ncbi:MAG: 23S rRNA (adenine(2503)-C(2))-methyltransferase RlmN [Gammaproteobacteria bacterium]|nr:23S rRNA (adenine(2503)-C(2))-methyltransferase RlmN [Gammaproteobacteria bacterium]
MMSTSSNFFDLSHAGLQQFFTDIGEKPYRASQLMKWIYHQGVIDVEQMTDMSKPLRQRLPEIGHFQLPEIVSQQTSSDGTCKWLLRVDPHNCIETVFIPEQERGTLCISSQVGCALDCSFCSTGKQGFNRNLSVAEIIGQLWLINQQLGHFQSKRRIITNVVMMGMGEPLLNFDNVITAIGLMMSNLGFNLAHKRVTLSTAGVVPAIDKLANISNISLAVSLHAPTDELRNTLVPLNRSYPISELLAACKRYARSNNGDPVTFEYILLAGVNDGIAEARQLARILRGIPAKINLIPFNPFPGSGYTRPAPITIDRFRDILVDAGHITITRKTRGGDINAACGQLAGQVIPRAKRLQNRLSGIRA